MTTEWKEQEKKVSWLQPPDEDAVESDFYLKVLKESRQEEDRLIWMDNNMDKVNAIYERLRAQEQEQPRIMKMSNGESLLMEEFPEDPDPMDLQGIPNSELEKAGWKNYWGNMNQDYFNKQIRESY